MQLIHGYEDTITTQDEAVALARQLRQQMMTRVTQIIDNQTSLVPLLQQPVRSIPGTKLRFHPRLVASNAA